LLLTPEYISRLVNFYSNTIEPDWCYDPKGKDMRNLQAKGAARVCNLLEEHKLALLADEVGMGKTIQALAVCAALWNENPSAKILILAPRDEIARNWEKEYQTFIRHHYRHSDNVVKSNSGQYPVKKMIYYSNLYSLVHEIQQGWGQLYIGKISSFSSLMSKKDVSEWLSALNISVNDKLKEKIEAYQKIKESKAEDKAKNKTALNRLTHEVNAGIVKELKQEIIRNSIGEKPYFDLLIIDEAHYFRRKESDSLRVNTATALFGDPLANSDIPLSRKTLLLTATPNHSSSKDIGNIISYFSKTFADAEYKNILDNICVRRLRRLSKHGYNKYNYRHEILSPSDFKENPLSEMFFGLYQHELVKEINKDKKEKVGNKGISRMMKYLEGVEFIPRENSDTIHKESEDDPKALSTDYHKGADAHVLLGISKKFKEIFSQEPHHPKYAKLVDDLTTKHTDQKAVVFVRRIPSVKEIAKRVVDYYDKRLWERLKQTGLESISYEKLDRRTFKKVTSSTKPISIPEEDANLGTDGDEEDDNIPTSKVLNLFKVIKGDTVISTHASNFRTRFTRSKPGIFSMFFSPGEDYFNTPYEALISYRFEVGNEELENYYNSALLHRTNKIEDPGTSKDILSNLLAKIPLPNSGDKKDFQISTLMTVFWDVFISDLEVPDLQRTNVESTYKAFTVYEREAFSNFLEKGTVLASEAFVWFYEIYRNIQEVEDEKPIKLYQKFIESIRADLRLSKLYIQIQESILHFRPIYTKVFSINGQKELLQESWDSFNNAQPVYPYNADNSNQKVLRCFNTPFFPDILVATSVLQEGVNLQYFCNTMYHYGMAWTPGDNEQRIGRVDRMFGKIERLLEQDNKSRLHIYYPYLKDTIDEEHLARFAKRKFKEETLIDRGKAFEETSDFAFEENDNDSWKAFMRIPDDNNLDDPFPVDTNHFAGIKQPSFVNTKNSLDEFYHSIINALRSLTEFNPEIFMVNQADNQKLLIDPTLNGVRKQPVIIELLFDQIGSGFYGEAVFCLSMKTPISAIGQYKKVKGTFNQSTTIQTSYLPGIKLCLDQSQTTGSNWGVYMANELPLFMKDLKDNPLSVEEIQKTFKNLICCADLTEKELFDRDIKKEELNLPIDKIGAGRLDIFRKASKQKPEPQWEERGNFYVLEKNIQMSNNIDVDKQALINNHKNHYVKNYYTGSRWKCQVGFFTDDAQKEELQLLQKHLEVFLNGRGWYN
jgi:ERCC4-related helicase